MGSPENEDEIKPEGPLIAAATEYPATGSFAADRDLVA
jgi:hypothetical protein